MTSRHLASALFDHRQPATLLADATRTPAAADHP